MPSDPTTNATTPAAATIPARHPCPGDFFKRFAERYGLKKGWVDDERRRETPWVVDCDGLSRAKLPPGVFEREFCERRDWLKAHCPGAFEIEPLGPNPEELTGRRFRFESDVMAVYFKLRFETNL